MSCRSQSLAKGSSMKNVKIDKKRVPIMTHIFNVLV